MVRWGEGIKIACDLKRMSVLKPKLPSLKAAGLKPPYRKEPDCSFPIPPGLRKSIPSIP